MPGLPAVTEAAVMPGDRRDPPAQRAAADGRRQRRQPGRDHHRVHRQQCRIDPVLPRPLAKIGPVAFVGGDRPWRDRFAGIVGGLGHRVGQRPIDEGQQLGRDVAAADEPADQSPRRTRVGPGSGSGGEDLAIGWIGGRGVARGFTHRQRPFRHLGGTL